MISVTQKDTILNALDVGMTLEDAYVLAGLNAEDINNLPSPVVDEFRVASKRHEFRLLHTLDDVMEKQRMVGKEKAVTWALEHMYARYGQKVTVDGQPITINFANDSEAADVEYDE